jgi:hypothetical protein
MSASHSQAIRVSRSDLVTSPFSRRRFLKVGMLGMMLNLPQLLWARAASSGTSHSGSEKSCIFIVQQGGCSHIDTWDMKPNAPVEYRGPLRPIATTVPGFQICEHMPQLARLAHRYAVIRSLNHRATGHGDGMHVCLSGQTQPERDAAYIGSVVSRVRPASRNVPSYVWIQDMASDAGTHYHTGGFLGSAHAPLRVGEKAENFAAENFRVTAFDPPAGVTVGRMEERRRLLEALTGDMAGAATDRFQKYQERAFDLVMGPEARQAFDIQREPAPVRDRYGRHPLGQNLLIARRLVDAGVRPGLPGCHFSCRFFCCSKRR